MPNKLRNIEDVTEPSLRALLEYLLFARSPSELLLKFGINVSRDDDAIIATEDGWATALPLWGKMYGLRVTMEDDRDAGHFPISLSLAPSSFIDEIATAPEVTQTRGEIGEKFLDALGDPDVHSTHENSVWVTWCVGDINVTYRYGPGVLVGAVIDMELDRGPQDD